MLPTCYLLRNCNQFYTGDKAEEFFLLTLNIAREHKLSTDEAYVLNNWGLELFRTGKREDAYKNFKISYDILIDQKFHKASYPLNNMAICEMFKGNFNQAIEFLSEAYYVNQSNYNNLQKFISWYTIK